MQEAVFDSARSLLQFLQEGYRRRFPQGLFDGVLASDDPCGDLPFLAGDSAQELIVKKSDLFDCETGGLLHPPIRRSFQTVPIGDSCSWLR